IFIEAHDRRSVGGNCGRAAAGPRRVSKADDAALLGPLEAFRTRTVPCQPNHNRAVATHAPGVAPTAVEDATFGGMPEIHPACSLLPHRRIRVAVSARAASHDRVAVRGDSD